MAFEQGQNITKVGIEDIEIRFFIPGPNNGNDVQSGQINFQYLMSDGSIRRGRQEDLLIRLTDDPTGTALLATLIDLRDYIRTRLNNEALP